MKPEQEESPEVFEEINYSLSQYVDMFDKNLEKTVSIFEDIVTVEDRYQHTNVINQGGMKRILKTTDSLTNRPVAKATLIDFEDSEKVENFLREARLSAALEHPNIIPVHDIGVDETEGPFFTMKLVGGQNLATILKGLSKPAGESTALPGNEKKYSIQDFMEVFLKVCDAVGYAHSRGVVHLDLKPENIQIGDYGEVLVCDWGLAKVLENPEDISEFAVDLDPYIYNGLTIDGTIKGTPGYMAPEQIDIKIGPKNKQTDIYALGGILYSLLCYKAPYESDTLDGILTKTLSGEIELPSMRLANDSPMIPASLEAVAIKALQTNPEDRYQSVSELKQEINKWMHGFATEAEEAGFIKSFWLLMNRHKVVSALLVILFFSGSVGVYKIKQNESIALVNERKSNERLNLLLQERKEKAEINKISADQLLLLSQQLLDESKFDFTMNRIQRSLVFQPENQILNALKGEIHFYRQEFGESALAFNKAGKKTEAYPYSLMQPLCEEYEKLVQQYGFVPATNFISLIFKFKLIEKERILNFERERFTLKENQSFEELMENRPLLDNHMKFCHLKIKRHAEINAVDNFTYSFDKDGINLDISGSTYEPTTGGLRHLPLKSLNISRTPFWRKWVFSHYHLKELDYRKSGIKKVEKREFANTKLKTVTLTEKQLPFLQLNIHGKRHGIKFLIKPNLAEVVETE